MSHPHTEKTVYFLRHGESEDNTKPVYQSFASPLSARGREQAEKVAERASRLDFQALISSPAHRARETAEIIGKATNKQAEYSELFVERIKPAALNGKPHDDPAAKALSKEWNKSLFQKGLRVGDGENYEDITARADRALDFLKDHTENKLLVVTHGFFFRTIITKVVLRDSMTAENLKNFQSAASMENTGLSVLHYSKGNSEKEASWKLWIYNDHSHLG